MIRVPLLDLERQNMPLEAELLDAFRRVVRSGHFILGPEVERFEADAAAMAGARYGIGVSSGTDAIVLALMALGIGAGDEVICPSFTFFATASSVARLGARPVFADSCAECFNLDPAALEPLIGPRTKAIIPVHLFGQAADLEPILAIARKHSLAVIEDAAQAFGAEYRGNPVGARGDLGTVSFFPTKNLGALGEAGLVVTSDAALAEKLRLLRNHGMQPRYYHRMIGGNFRLDALQAAMLAVKLPHLPEYTAARQRNACFYQRALGGLRGIVTPATHPDRDHIVNQYTIRVEGGRRDALRKHLESRGIASEIYYPVPLHKQECFRSFDPPPVLPVAEKLAEEALSLPVFPEMTEEEQQAVAEAIAGFANG